MPQPAFDTLDLQLDTRGVARVTLNLPDTHNALNATLICQTPTGLAQDLT